MVRLSPLGRFLRVERARRGLGVRELSRLAGLSPSHYQRLEAGEVAMLSPETVRGLSAALEVSAVEVLRAAGYLR